MINCNLCRVTCVQRHVWSVGAEHALQSAAILHTLSFLYGVRLLHSTAVHADTAIVINQCDIWLQIKVILEEKKGSIVVTARVLQIITLPYYSYSLRLFLRKIKPNKEMTKC